MATRALILVLAASSLLVCQPPAQAAQIRPLTEWYTDYARPENGGSITSPSKLHGGSKLVGILGKMPGGDIGCVFPDRTDQREEFTIDLGQTRKLGLIEFECELAGRIPKALTIQVSNQSASGPWKTVFQTDHVLLHHAVGIDDELPARWIHVDLGTRTDGKGSRVRRIRVYPRYHLQSAAEIIQDFQHHIKRDVPELADFWKAIDAKRWNDACDELIEFYAAHGEPLRKESKLGEPPPRAQRWMENRVEDGGHTYQFESSDWNWRALEPGAPGPSLGLLPGAYSIFNDLANAYLVTRDAKYARKTLELVTDWLQDNPYPGWHADADGDLIGAWIGLTISGRTGVLSKMIDVFSAESEVLTRDFKMNLVLSLWQHLEILDVIRLHVGGNWLTNVNSGLFGGAIEHPEFVEQKQWIEDSMESFEKSLLQDVYPCGREVEDSTQYVPIASGQMLGQYAGVREAGLRLSDEAERRMSLLYDAIAWVGYPDGSGPAVGDCFRLSPLRKGGGGVPEEFLRLFDRPDLKYISTQGKEGVASAQTSREFAGWYIMRSPWEERPFENARQMFFKNTENRTHCHLDQLQILLYAYGREILTDPAMVGYGLGINRTFSGTPYHSTICVNGSDQDHKEGTQNAWAAGKGADFVDGEFHYGTVIGRRQILFVKSGLPDYWLVHDRLNGRQTEHTFDVNFNLSEGASPVVKGRSARTTYSKDGNLLIQGAGDSPVPILVDYQIADRLRGPVPAKCVRYRVKSQPSVRFDTFLVPYNGTKAPAFSADELASDQADPARTASAFAVRAGAGTDVVLLSVEPGQNRSFGNGKLVSDAQALVLRFDSDGKLVHAFQYGGTETTYEGKSIIKVNPGESFAEMGSNPGGENDEANQKGVCLLYTSPSPRDRQRSRMPSSA